MLLLSFCRRWLVVAKKGAQYKCEECGMIVTVADPCSCASCDLICCGVPMKEVKPKAKAKKAR